MLILIGKKKSEKFLQNNMLDQATLIPADNVIPIDSTVLIARYQILSFTVTWLFDNVIWPLV